MKPSIKLSVLSPRAILVRSAMICALLGAVFFGLALHKIEPLPVSGAILKFEASRAHEQMTKLAKGFPNRVPWNPNRQKAALWLQSEFAKMGYAPMGMRFSGVIAGKQYTDLENVYVERRGKKHPNEIIVAVAHYDITDTTVEGAMDDASGVGVVLELARVFANENPDRTLIFLATDSEEFGAFWGAHAFAKQFEHADKIVAVASFDFVAAGKQTGVLTLCDGLKQGYTPLWLRELALDSLRSLGSDTKVLDMTGFMEFALRAMQIPAADHGAFLEAGIPAFNWVGQTEDFAHLMAHYHHTPNDVAEALSPESFEPFGKGAERLIRSIDALPKLPADLRNSSYWKISERLYVEGWAVTILHILAFIPFLAYSLTKFRRTFRARPASKIVLVLKNEAKRAGILLGSMLLGYGVIRMLPALKMITQYEVFPATQKSLLLYTPNFLAILVVLGTVLAVYWAFRHTFREPEDSIEYFEIRHAFHAAFLALVIILAFMKNSYLATLMLLPPAYLWTFLRTGRKPENRALNVLLLLGGSITLVAMAVILTQVFHVGVVYWYLFLSAAYGLISAYTVIIFLMVLTVMIRLFRSFVL